MSTEQIKVPISSGQGSNLTCVVCKESLNRTQDVKRHIQLCHLPCCVYCPYSECNWRGGRVDELLKHLAPPESHNNSEKPGEEYRIYDADMILEWIKDAGTEDFIRIAQNWALDLVRERAKELGRDEWLADPWGRLEQRERREKRPRLPRRRHVVKGPKEVKKDEVPRPHI